MNHVSDTATAGNGGDFDPCQAAALLDQVTQRARRTFTPLRLYPASAPLLIIGLASAAVGAAFRYWPLAGTSLGTAVVAAAAGFGGPAGSWLITGIGLCAVYLGIAAFTAWWQRSGVVRP